MEFKDFTNKPFLSEGFIEIYDNVIPKNLCDDLITYFEENKDLQKVGNSGIATSGLFEEKDDKIYNVSTGIEVKKDDEEYLSWCKSEKERLDNIKNTTELTLEGIASNMVESLLQKGKLPNTDVAQFFRLYSNRIDDYIAAYVNKYKVMGINNSNSILNRYQVKKSTAKLFPHQIQKYKKDIGHYNAWHCEWTGNPQDPSIMRTLITMLYLNDVDEGGCTQFYNQNLDVQPKAGRLVLFPAYFTHTHRGQTPISNDKYIITSMFGFGPPQ